MERERSEKFVVEVVVVGADAEVLEAENGGWKIRWWWRRIGEATEIEDKIVVAAENGGWKIRL